MSTALRFFEAPLATPLSQLRAAPVWLLLALLLAFAAHGKHHWGARPRRVGFASDFAAAILLATLGVMLTAAGCGGGSTANAPAQVTPVVTPQGTSTIMDAVGDIRERQAAGVAAHSADACRQLDLHVIRTS